MSYDILGNRYGRLTVVASGGRDKRGRSRWECVCDCGNVKIIDGYRLKHGDTLSCGCLQKERARDAHMKHGYNKKGSCTKEYNSWLHMLSRCYNTKNKSYRYYGGRGIKVCDEWKDFRKFIEDMGDCPKDKESIDRIDNNGDYTPENCRWADRSEQNNNKNSNVFITHNGETLTITEWAKRLGTNDCTIRGRIRRGWKVEDAVSLPVKKKRMFL